METKKPMLGLWISHSVEFRARSSKPRRFNPCVAEGTHTELALSHPAVGTYIFRSQVHSQLHSSYWPDGTFTQIGAKCLVCFKSLMSYWCIIQVLSFVLLLLVVVLFDNTITNLTQHNLTCLFFGFATGVVCTRETWWQSRTHKPCLSAEIQLMSESRKAK